MAAVELLLRAACVDLFRLQRIFRKNRYALGKHFDESPVDVIALFSGVAAMQTNFARAQLGEQGRMPEEHFKVSGAGGQLHGIRRRVDEDALGSDEPNL